MEAHPAEDENDVYMANFSQTVSECDEEDEVEDDDSMVDGDDAALGLRYQLHMREAAQRDDEEFQHEDSRNQAGPDAQNTLQTAADQTPHAMI